MKVSLLLLCNFLACTAWGGSSERAPKTADVHIIQVDPNLPVEKFSEPGVQVHPVAEREVQSSPLPNLRDALLAEVGLSKQTESWDHFERDMLMQRLLHQNVAKVAKRYPKLPRESLVKLKSMLEVLEKEKGGKR